jgi:hypothetical protein
MVFGQIRQITIRQLDAQLLAEILSGLDVAVADLVANSARSGVQRRPHIAVGVFSKLDEVIAATQRAKRQPPVFVVLIRSGPGLYLSSVATRAAAVVVSR